MIESDFKYWSKLVNENFLCLWFENRFVNIASDESFFGVIMLVHFIGNLSRKAACSSTVC